MPANDVLKRYKIDEKSLGESQAKLHQLRQAIQNSFNPSTGQIEFNKLIKEQKINLKDLSQEMLRYGAEGQSAFLNLANSAINLNEHFKHSFAWLSKIGTTFMNTIRWQISTRVIQGFTGAISNAYSYAKSLDSSLNDIRIVTGKSADEMERFAKTANTAAKELGTATTEYTNASLIYYQQGLGNAEVEKRAETTVKVSNVTGMSARDTSDALTALWNGFKVSLDETELYVDKLAAVAASSASNLEELTTAMSKVAATANTVGVDIDQLTAQISTIVSVTRQAPESVGTALKTIYARIGDLKIDGADEDGVALGQVSSQMEELGIQILDTNGDMREMGTILEDVAEKWNKWTTAQKQAAAIAMAGKRQYTMLMSLFEGWEMYSKEVQIAANSQGTLQRQQDIYLDSMEAHLQQFETAKEALKGEFVDSGAVNNVVDIFTKLTESVTKFIQNIGGGKKVLWDLVAALSALSSNAIGSGIAKVVQNLQSASIDKLELQAQAEAVRQMRDALVEAEDKGEISKVFATHTKAVFENIKSASDLIESGVVNKDTSDKIQELISNQINQVKELGKAANETELAFEKIFGGDFGQDIVRGNQGLDFNQLKNDLTFTDEQEEEIHTVGISISKIREEITQLGLEGKNFAQIQDELASKGTPTYLSKLIEKTQDLNKAIQDLLTQVQDIENFNPNKFFNKFENSAAVTSGFIDLSQQEKVNEAYQKLKANEHYASLDKTKYKIDTNEDYKANTSLTQKGTLYHTSAAYQEIKRIYEEQADLLDNSNKKIAKNLLKGAIAGPQETQKAINNILDNVVENAKKNGDKLKGNFRKTAEEVLKDGKKTAESIGKSMDKVSEETSKTANTLNNSFLKAIENLKLEQKIQGVTTFASSLLMITRGISSISSAMDNLADTSKSAAERTGAFFQSLLSTVVMLGPAILRLISLIKDGTYTAPQLAAAAVIIYSIYKVITLIVEATTREERELKKLKQTVIDLKASQDELNQSISSMKSEWESINSSRDALDDMVKGTDEWKQKVSELNEQVIKLATTYPELLAGLKKNADGIYSIDENTYNKFLESQLERSRTLQIQALSTQNDVYNFSKYDVKYKADNNEIKKLNGTLIAATKDLTSFREIQDELIKTGKFTYTEAKSATEAIIQSNEETKKNNKLIEANNTLIGQLVLENNGEDLGEAALNDIAAREAGNYSRAILTDKYTYTGVSQLEGGIGLSRFNDSKLNTALQDFKDNGVIKDFTRNGEKVVITYNDDTTSEVLKNEKLIAEINKLFDQAAAQEAAQGATLPRAEEEAFRFRDAIDEIVGPELGKLVRAYIHGDEVSSEDINKLQELSSEQMEQIIYQYELFDSVQSRKLSSYSLKQSSTEIEKQKSDFAKTLTKDDQDFKKNIQSTIEKAITGDISDTEFTTLTDTLNELVTEFPELIKYQEILNNKSLKGTEEWIQNLYKLQKDLNKEQLKAQIQDSSDLINEILNLPNTSIHTVYGNENGATYNSKSEKIQSQSFLSEEEFYNKVEQAAIDNLKIIEGSQQTWLEKYQSQLLDAKDIYDNYVSKKALYYSTGDTFAELEYQDAQAYLSNTLADIVPEYAKLSIEDIENFYDTLFSNTPLQEGEEGFSFNADLTLTTTAAETSYYQFKNKLEDIAEADYTIDITIHSNAEDEFNNIEKSIDSMTDMAEKIGENFVVNAEDLRELNQVFPNIIDNMEILEDGTVQLNETAVQEAMDTAATQIASSNEATIVDLQNQATILRAKEATYKSIADTAAAMARGDIKQEEGVLTIKQRLRQTESANNAEFADTQIANTKNEADSMAQSWNYAYEYASKSAIDFGNIAFAAYRAGTGDVAAHNYLQDALNNTNFKVNYTGYDPESSEVAQFESYEDLVKDPTGWLKISQIYNQQAEAKGALASDLEGMIAERQASGYAALFGLGSVRSGKGFGTGSSTEDELDNEIDKYKTINEELELYSKNLSLISNLKEKAYGKEYIKLLNQEADIYSNQVETLKQKGEMLAEDAGARRNTLAANGFVFDEQGNILNYYERLSELYNAGSDSYEQLKEIADEYFDYLNDCYDNLEEQFEAEDKHHQALIDSLKQEIELVQELNDYQNDYADFIIKIAEDDEYLKRAQEYGIKLTADFNALKEYEARAQKLLAEHDKMLKEGSSDIYGDDLKQLRKDIEENQKALEDFIISMADSYESAMDEYLALIDATANAFKEEVKILEHAIKEIQHYAKIQKAVLGESDMATVVALDQAQLATQNKITENYRKEADFWRQQMDRTVDKTSEAYKKMKENYETAIDSMESSMEEAIAAATQKAADALKQIQLEFESAITEGSTFGRVSNEWEMQKKIEKDSYDAANRAFKLAELRYNYTKAAEEASAEGQARINKLMEEQLSMLHEKDKLTQYDVERAQKLLDIELARIALEEAQNNKNQMRLKRDAAGNYTYQYVADQGAIDDAQQKYDAARNSLYNFDKNAYQSTTTEILSRLQEAEKKFADIRSDSSLSAEAREEELNKWYEYYQEYVANRTEEIEGIRVNLEEDAQIEWENYYKDSLDRAYTNGKEMMDKTVAGYTLAGKSVIEITTLDADRINTELTHLKDHTIENLHEWLANVDEATEIARYDYENLTPAIEELNEETLTSVAYASAYTDTLTAAMGPMGDYIDELSAIKEAYDTVGDAAKALVDQEEILLENQKTIELNLDTLLNKMSSLIIETQKYIDLDTASDGNSKKVTGVYANASNAETFNLAEVVNNKGQTLGYGAIDNNGNIIKLKYNGDTSGLGYYFTKNPEGLTTYIAGNIGLTPKSYPGGFQLIAEDDLWKRVYANKISDFSNQFDTGGYTGEWGLDGRMAVLHQKELVLNAKDTENMLKMLDITRKAFENATVRGILANSFATPSSNVTSNEQIGTTYMTINATFPNANKAIEIEEAFKNLKNYASQQAHMQVYQNGINNFSKTFI
jgi:TP901 family phage tail tape measure protein